MAALRAQDIQAMAQMKALEAAAKASIVLDLSRNSADQQNEPPTPRFGSMQE